MLKPRGIIPAGLFLFRTHFFKKQNMKKRMPAIVAAIFLFSGCSSVSDALGTSKLEVPIEFNQKVLLEVSDKTQSFQASRSQYDPGDIQAFQSQHTFPIVVEDAFREMFSQLEVVTQGENIELSQPDVPAVFEVRMLDLANDISNEASSYRAETTLAVAMKSPRGHIFWQKAFRGEGYAIVDPQFSNQLGPQDAVVDAVRDALSQMQNTIVKSPEVLNQLRHYSKIEEARRETEAKL